MAQFGNFGWDVLTNRHGDCPFFTSDYPIASEPTADPRVLNLIVPLTPMIAVRIKPDISIPRSIGETDVLPRSLKDFDFSRFSLEQQNVTRREAIRINQLLVRAAEATVFYRDDLPWVTNFIRKNRNYRMDTQYAHIPQGGQTLQWSRLTTTPFDRSAPTR